MSLLLTPFAVEAKTPTRIQTKAFFKDDTVWPSTNIPVCWETLNDSTALNRWNKQLTKTALSETWEANSMVRFTGWGMCPTTYFPGVRIGTSDLKDAAPIAWGLGTQIKGKLNGVELDFKLTKVTPSNPLYPIGLSCYRAGISHDECIKLTVAHEFGHILGLSHETNRKDDPDPWFNLNILSCHFDNLLSDNVHGNTYFTDYDPDSIMNYCRENYNGRVLPSGAPFLSDTDKLAVKVYYGNIPSYKAATSILSIPRLWMNNNSYKVELKNVAGKFVLLKKTLTNGLPENMSSAVAAYSSPYMILPMVKLLSSSGRVIQLWKYTLKWSAIDGAYIQTTGSNLLQPLE